VIHTEVVVGSWFIRFLDGLNFGTRLWCRRKRPGTETKVLKVSSILTHE